MELAARREPTNTRRHMRGLCQTPKLFLRESACFFVQRVVFGPGSYVFIDDLFSTDDSKSAIQAPAGFYPLSIDVDDPLPSRRVGRLNDHVFTTPVFHHRT